MKKKDEIVNNNNINKNEKKNPELNSLLNNKIIYIQEIIRNTIISIQKNKQYEIFSNSDIDICITILNDLYLKTVSLFDENKTPIPINTDRSGKHSQSVAIVPPLAPPFIPNNVDILIESLQQVIDKLSIIISGFGTNHMEDLLYICFGSDFIKTKNENTILEEKFNLIKKYLHPIGYKIINWKNNKEFKKDYPTTTYCENKLQEENQYIEKSNNYECYDIKNTNNVIYLKVYGIQTIIKNEKMKKTIIINCVYDEIPLDFFSNEYIHFRKRNILNNIPISDTFDIDIIERIIDSFTIKDILIYGNDDIYKKQLHVMSDVNSVKYNKLDITIKKFLESDIIAQRSLLIHLLLYNKDYNIQYITYLLYDLTIVHSNHENIDSIQKKILYNYLPLKIKSYFKDTMNVTIKFSQEMISKYDINKITLEQQVYLLKAPECIKEKAIIKLKEIKNKNDDSSGKAKQYLEGLIKIPFGVYKKEPILKIMKDINKKFISLLDKNSDFLNIYFKNNNGSAACETNATTHVAECDAKTTNSLSLSNIFEKKDLYVKIEIVNYIHTIENIFYEQLVKDLKKKIMVANNKQIINIIHFFQNLLKNNILFHCNHSSNIHNCYSDKFKEILDNLINNKTKQKRITFINNLLDYILPLIEKNNDNIHNFLKIYDCFENTQLNTIIKIPSEVKEIKSNIKDINNYLNDINNLFNDSIYGHTHAKNQMLKIISQWMTGEQNGYCFGFEGPPGVGKTSLAKQGLANCLKDENNVNRPFSFIALGGSSNGSSLEGHSYTYVNSSWGKIVDILMESKCMNPIIYIDELDKVSKTEQGREIIGILTHLIDTTQNDIFQDKYFSGIELDLSKALFIFSYNDPDAIDKILLDRIHRIKFDHLSLNDKIVIVDKHILPEINTKMGFNNTVILSKDITKFIIETYTLEPGVRKLKEILFDLFGEINIQILNSNNDHNIVLPIVITIEDLENIYLKKYTKIEEKKINSTNKVGIINGLWANNLGIGGIIPIETVFFPSSTFLELRLTGLQGDVMKESMNVSKTLAWSLTDEEVKKELIQFFNTTKCQGLHIHCPDGSVSKDGPSAGTAITVAIYSLLNKKKIKRDIAITGEINLQGDVTPIGSLEEKILGGIKAGTNTFLFPKANWNDYTKFIHKKNDTHRLENITFVPVNNIKEVFEYVFE